MQIIVTVSKKDYRTFPLDTLAPRSISSVRGMVKLTSNKESHQGRAASLIGTAAEMERLAASLMFAAAETRARGRR